MTKEEMDRLTGGTDNKSEKIRILFNADVPRAEIARFLGITYQHAQNVLKRSGLLEKAERPQDAAHTGQVYTVRIGEGGKFTLPPEYVEKCGIRDGEVLICREEGGGLTIMSRDAAIAALNEIVRQRMPAEAALLETLLADRSGSS